MIVTNIAGTSEIITGYTQLSRKRRVNGEQSLSFLLPKTDRNAHSFDLVAEESIVEYDGISYRIKGLVEQTKGKPIKSITAYHVFFDLVDEFRYNVLTTGYKSLHEVMSFIFADTEYTFVIIDTFASQEFENFGNDNCLALFQKVLDRYQAEYELIGNQVRIKKKIGANIDFQFRYGFNIKTFKRTVNTSNLSTYIKGTGKLNEDGTPIVEGEYTSPMAAVYGIRHSPPYSNESITVYDTLIENLKAKIQDTPEVSIELEFVSLQEQGYPADDANMGDVVPTIYEPLNVDLDLRIIEIEDYPEAKRSPKVTLSTVPKAFVNAVMDYQKNLMDKIYDPTTNRARYNVLPDAIKRATEALQSAQTELEFTNGIIARSKDNANHLVLLNSNGIGISRDGGQTFTEAITSDGFVLSAGAIGVLAANHIQIGAQTTYDVGYDPTTKETPDGAQSKANSVGQALRDDLRMTSALPTSLAINQDGITAYTSNSNQYARMDYRGFYAKQGAFAVERPDGYLVVNNGILANSFSIQGSEPAFQAAGVTKNGQFYQTQSSARTENIQRFVFKHDSRYVRIICNMYTIGNSQAGNIGSLAFDVFNDDETQSITSAVVTESRLLPSEGSQGHRKDILLDLGTPTGQIYVMYWRMWNSVEGWYVNGSVRYLVAEG